MSPLINALVAYLKTLEDENFSILGSNNQVKVSFPDGQAIIHMDGRIVEHRKQVEPEVPEEVRSMMDIFLEREAAEAAAAAASSADDAPPSESKVTEEHYDQLTELIQLKHTLILDAKNPFTEDSELSTDQHNLVALGSLNYEFPGAVSGGLFSQHIFDQLNQSEREDFQRDSFRFFETETGELAVEITYIPLSPYDEKEALLLFKSTRLSEFMTEEEFLADHKADASWFETVFSSTSEIYDLAFDVVPAGATPVHKDFELDSYMGDPIFGDSIAVTYEGQDYDIYVLEHVD